MGKEEKRIETESGRRTEWREWVRHLRGGDGSSPRFNEISCGDKLLCKPATSFIEQTGNIAYSLATMPWEECEATSGIALMPEPGTYWLQQSLADAQTLEKWIMTKLMTTWQNWTATKIIQ